MLERKVGRAKPWIRKHKYSRSDCIFFERNALLENWRGQGGEAEAREEGATGEGGDAQAGEEGEAEAREEGGEAEGRAGAEAAGRRVGEEVRAALAMGQREDARRQLQRAAGRGVRGRQPRLVVGIHRDSIMLPTRRTLTFLAGGSTLMAYLKYRKNRLPSSGLVLELDLSKVDLVEKPENFMAPGLAVGAFVTAVAGKVNVDADMRAALPTRSGLMQRLVAS